MTPYLVRPNHSYFARSRVEQQDGDSHYWLITETIETSPDGKQNVVSSTAQVRQAGIQTKGAKRVRQPTGFIPTQIPVPPPVKRPDALVSEVPFVSQLAAGGDCPSNLLCQYACAAMLAGKYWDSSFASAETVQRMAKHAKGKVCTNDLSNINEAKAALDSLGTTRAAVTSAQNFERIKEYLHHDIALSISLKYLELGSLRKDKKWGGGHQVVLIGVSERKGTWTYLDPLGNSSQPVEVESAVFRDAVSSLKHQSDGFWTLHVL